MVDKEKENAWEIFTLTSLTNEDYTRLVENKNKYY